MPFSRHCDVTRSWNHFSWKTQGNSCKQHQHRVSIWRQSLHIWDFRYKDNTAGTPSYLYTRIPILVRWHFYIETAHRKSSDKSNHDNPQLQWLWYSHRRLIYHMNFDCYFVAQLHIFFIDRSASTSLHSHVGHIHDILDIWGSCLHSSLVNKCILRRSFYDGLTKTVYHFE